MTVSIARLSLLCSILGVGPTLTSAQSASSRGRPALGIYAGLVSEVGQFDRQRVTAAEEESGRIGVLIGRWSVGLSGKTLQRSVVAFSPGAEPEVSKLQVSGIEVGRLFRRVGPIQLAGFATVGRGRVSVSTPGRLPVNPGGPSTPSRSLGSSSSMLIEPAVSVGVALGPVFRIDARAGARLGGSANVAGRSIGTSGGFVGVTWALGWLGDWRMRAR